MNRRWVVAALGAVLLPTAGQAAVTVPARVVRGEYEYRTVASNTYRATEHFLLVAHPDGSRTLTTSLVNVDSRLETAIVLRVDPSFRAREAFVTSTHEGRFVASAFFVAADGRWRATIRTPDGESTQSVPLGDDTNVITHAVASDGWKILPDALQPGRDYPLEILSIDPRPTPPVPFLASRLSVSLRYVGVETVDVPAGRFQARHFSVAGLEMWTVGPDRLLVKMLDARADRVYVLKSIDARRYPE